VDPENLGDSSLGFYRVWVTHLGRRFGLLQELAEGEAPLTPGALAAKRACHAPTVAAWCEAAHALGLLERNRGRYSVPPRLRAILADEAHASYLGGQFSYLALRSLDYDGFDGLFRRGVTPSGVPPHMVRAVTEATRWDHTAFVKIALPRFADLNARLARGARVLDVGSGSGGWDVRMAGEFPRSSFVGIEPNADALRTARKEVVRARLGGRVRFVHGSGETMAFRQEFDVAYLGEVLSAVASKERLLRRCHRALHPGGRLVVVEGLLDRTTSPRSPVNQLLYAMQLDFALQGTGLMTRSELRTLLGDRGFRRPVFLHAGGGLWFVIAAK
jgi:SAM-dependent methyltransferase